MSASVIPPNTAQVFPGAAQAPHNPSDRVPGRRPKGTGLQPPPVPTDLTQYQRYLALYEQYMLATAAFERTHLQLERLDGSAPTIVGRGGYFWSTDLVPSPDQVTMQTAMSAPPLIALAPVPRASKKKGRRDPGENAEMPAGDPAPPRGRFKWSTETSTRAAAKLSDFITLSVEDALVFGDHAAEVQEQMKEARKQGASAQDAIGTALDVVLRPHLRSALRSRVPPEATDMLLFLESQVPAAGAQPAAPATAEKRQPDGASTGKRNQRPPKSKGKRPAEKSVADLKDLLERAKLEKALARMTAEPVPPPRKNAQASGSAEKREKKPRRHSPSYRLRLQRRAEKRKVAAGKAGDSSK